MEDVVAVFDQIYVKAPDPPEPEAVALPFDPPEQSGFVPVILIERIKGFERVTLPEEVHALTSETVTE